jgi:tetratricopeptide (TPR) repeat protein
VWPKDVVRSRDRTPPNGGLTSSGEVSDKVDVAAVHMQTRRAQRVLAKCPTEVAFGAGRWVGLTEDLGAGGCRIVSRLALRPGELVELKLRYGGVGFELDVVGTVAWTAPRPPWRTGVAFARGQEEKARRFVRAVLQAAPELAPEKPEGGFRRPSFLSASRRPAATLLQPRAAHVRALLLAARSQSAAGNPEEAIRSLRAALELAPDNEEVLAELRAMGVVEGE